MSDLPAIDNMITEAVRMVRRQLEQGVDEKKLEEFLDMLTARHPELSILGMTHHLGMLVITRAQCAEDEERKQGSDES